VRPRGGLRAAPRQRGQQLRGAPGERGRRARVHAARQLRLRARRRQLQPGQLGGAPAARRARTGEGRPGGSIDRTVAILGCSSGLHCLTGTSIRQFSARAARKASKKACVLSVVGDHIYTKSDRGREGGRAT